MERHPSLCELAPRWREGSGALVEKVVAEIAADLTAEGPPACEPLRQRLRAASAQLVAACRDWLAAVGCWERAAALPAAEPALTAALAELPLPDAFLPSPAHVSPWAWALPAGLSALAGALGLAQLNHWYSPQGAELFTPAVAAGSSIFLVGALGAVALVYALRPRAPTPSLEEQRTRLRNHLAPLLRQHADFVLACSASAPQSEAPPTPSANAGPSPEVLAALDALRTACETTPASTEHVRDAAGALFQRLREEGYAWHVVERGAPYADAMTHSFDRFALIAPGQPVETLRPAILYRGEPVVRGLLRRLLS